LQDIMNDIKRLPARSEVAESDTWDLSKLFENDQAWETSFLTWESQIESYAPYRGRLAESPAVLAECLAFDSQHDRQGERLGNYAYLRTTEDQTNGDYQRMMGRFQNVATRAGEAASYIRPEILAIAEEPWSTLIAAPEIAPYRLMLERMIRYKPHTLTEREEELLAMQGKWPARPPKFFGSFTTLI
jgi:oligoendopeptidase F